MGAKIVRAFRTVLQAILIIDLKKRWLGFHSLRNEQCWENARYR